MTLCIHHISVYHYYKLVFYFAEKLTGLAASVIFKIPVVRELFLSMGYIDADRKVASKALAKGRSLFICVGGEDESLR